MLKKSWAAFLIAVVCLIPSVPAFADRGEGHERHREFQHERFERNFPRRVVKVLVDRRPVFYSSEAYYSQVPVLTPGYSIVIINGVPYYRYDNGYYVRTAAPCAFAVNHGVGTI